ncbi:putative phage abortive infection protein [Mesorhizobium sp. M0254]|uniref:putative phage abortive infection protein n=1 Tax=Mesorhizobium sp. M0254 TaxID=2956927 RepID=UPI00333DD639
MSRRLIFWVALFAIFLWVVWATLPFLAQIFGAEWNPSTMGQWGDTFGALNALTSSFAFAAVLYTIWMQQRQIGEARIDQHRQQFDDVFFRLLSLMRDVRGELRYTRSTVEKARETSGGQALRGAANDALHYIIDKSPANRELTREEIANIYAIHVHKRSEAGLGPYFRLIYTILKRIDTDPILTEVEKISYGNLLRGQLGSPEIALLALNGLTKDSNDLATYLNRFRMMRYLPKSAIWTAVRPWYDASAFEPRND